MPIATVAEMTGTSPEMIAKVYSHLSDKKALLLKAANKSDRQFVGHSVRRGRVWEGRRDCESRPPTSRKRLSAIEIRDFVQAMVCCDFRTI